MIATCTICQSNMNYEERSFRRKLKLKEYLIKPCVYKRSAICMAICGPIPSADEATCGKKKHLETGKQTDQLRTTLTFEMVLKIDLTTLTTQETKYQN